MSFPIANYTESAVAQFSNKTALPHIKNNVKEFLHKMFTEDRIMSRQLKNPWPPRSPDLTPLDFWFWGKLKRIMYSGSKPA